jgi:hypothetical protein
MFNHTIGSHAPGHGPQISHGSDKEKGVFGGPDHIALHCVHRYATRR